MKTKSYINKPGVQRGPLPQ